MVKKKVSARGSRKSKTPANSLPDGLIGTELGARRAQRLGTIEALKSARTPLTVIAVAERAAALAEETIHAFMATNPPPPLACREGCDWCCHLTVGTTVPEVLRIVEYLRRTLSPEEFQATRERIAESSDPKRPMSLGQRAAARLPCPPLGHHRCAA